MTEARHTPGPWRVFICDDGGEWSGWPLSICSVDDEDKSIVRPGGSYPYEWDAAMSQREAVANARLIAASPDMLTALQQVEREMQAGFGSSYGETREAVRRAIAKATGEA